MNANASANVDDVLRRFLLGALSPEAREGVEARLFSDDAIFWEHLCLVEDELIDDYVANDLQPDDRAAFERRFLSTEERRRKVEFARALKAQLEVSVSNRVGAWSTIERHAARPAWAFAAAVVLLVVPVLVWQLAVERSRQEEVSVWLSSRLTRGVTGELTRVQIPRAARLVRLHLELETNNYPFYKATLNEAGGSELWSQRNLTATMVEGRIGVSLTLPSELLDPGDYYLNLDGIPPREGIERLSRFDFRVSRP
jgi:anti-sigma factor RsiW